MKMCHLKNYSNCAFLFNLKDKIYEKITPQPTQIDANYGFKIE